MNEIELMINNMKALYEKLSNTDSVASVNDLRSLYKFTKDYAIDIQELMYEKQNK